MARKLSRPAARHEQAPECIEQIPKPEATAQAEDLRGDLDALLDEIDKVLEPQAEEFVRHYIQRGGE